MAKNADKARGKKKGPAYKIVEKQTRAAQPPRLRERYRSDVVSALMEEFGYKNVMQVPRVQKITINMGLGQAVANPNIIQGSLDEMTQISAQKAVSTRARKSISNFKLREGMPIGCMVTLRRERMWEFLDRLVGVAMPRMRDFRGISGKSFDGRGNYNLGLRDQTIFPEISYEQVDAVRGMNITICTSANNDAEAKSLLKNLGLPFRN
jgi:large subunit ribosomal protein L5